MARAARGEDRTQYGPGAHAGDKLPIVSVFVRFKGQSKSETIENITYYAFTPGGDGAFEAFLVNKWYDFRLQPRHRTLTAEEAEQEWSRSWSSSGHTAAVRHFMWNHS